MHVSQKKQASSCAVEVHKIPRHLDPVEGFPDRLTLDRVAVMTLTLSDIL